MLPQTISVSAYVQSSNILLENMIENMNQTASTIDKLCFDHAKHR